MIVDSLRNWEAYRGILPNFEVAMRFASSLQSAPVGRYDCAELPQGTVYAMMQEGETQPREEGKIEAHRRYADVQIMLEGGETVYCRDIDGLTETVPYVDDIAFYENAGQPLDISAGMLYIALPQDGHMPCRHLNGAPGRYRKIVLKIRL